MDKQEFNNNTNTAVENQQPYSQQPPAPAAQEKLGKYKVGLGILSYFIPIAGLIIFFCVREESPKTAKVCLKCAIASVVINVALSILLYVLIIGSTFFLTF